MVELAGPDRALFKYCSHDTATIVLTTGRLRWSRPGAFNDIFDVQIDFDMRLNTDVIVETALARLWEIAQDCSNYKPTSNLGLMLKSMSPRFLRMGQAKLRAEFEETFRQSVEHGLATADKFKQDIRELLAKAKIICFSDDPLSRLLWGHYGEQFQGAVLEFRNVAGLDSPYKGARKVEYTLRAPRLVTESDVSLMLTGETDLDELGAMNRFIWTKHEEWAGEKEWRMASGFGRRPNDPYEDMAFDARELATVLIGPRAPQQFRQRILQIVNERYPWTAVEEVYQGEQFGLGRRLVQPPQTLPNNVGG